MIYIFKGGIGPAPADPIHVAACASSVREAINYIAEYSRTHYPSDYQIQTDLILKATTISLQFHETELDDKDELYSEIYDLKDGDVWIF